MRITENERGKLMQNKKEEDSWKERGIGRERIG